MTSADVVPMTVAKAIAELRGITGICKASWVESIVGVIEAESKAAGFWMQEAARDHNDLIRATTRAEAAEAESARRMEALQAVTDEYCALVNSGDAGFWNPEDVEAVQKARAVGAVARL